MRAIIFGAALALGSIGVAAVAHDDPRQMGAGPGIDAPDHHDKVAPGEMQRLAEEGTMPMMADGTIPEGADEALAEMDHQFMEAMGHDHGADNSGKSFGRRLFIWLGKLHSAVIHFPIAMIIGAFALEAFGVARNRPDWRSAARIMLVVGAFSAVVAAALGWFAGGFYLVDRNLVLTAHRYLGMGITVAAVLLAWAGTRRDRVKSGQSSGFTIMLGLLSLAVAVQGFFGGTFMHGGLSHMNF